MKRKIREAQIVSTTEVVVRFSEVDSMQVVWHGEYVKYFEDGREDFGRKHTGLGYMDFFDNGFLTPIVDINIQYKKPLKCNDIAVVETRYIATDAAKICFDYIIRNKSNGEIVATGSTTQAFIDLQGELQLVAPDFYINWKKKWIE